MPAVLRAFSPDKPPSGEHPLPMSLTQTRMSPVRQILELLEPEGVDWIGSIRSPFQQTAPPVTSAELTSSQILQLLSIASELSDDPAFGLRLGSRLDLASMGVLGFAVKSCVNLEQVCKFLIRYNVVFNLGRVWEFHDYDENVALRFCIKHGSARQQQLAVEAAFTQFFGISICLPRPLEVIRVDFGFPQPAYYRRYKKYIPAPLLFGQSTSQIVFPKRLLESPTASANPAAYAVFEKQWRRHAARGAGLVQDTTA